MTIPSFRKLLPLYRNMDYFQSFAAAVNNHIYMSIPIISNPVQRVYVFVILVVQICINFQFLITMKWWDSWATVLWKVVSHFCLDLIHLLSWLQVMLSFYFGFNNVSQATLSEWLQYFIMIICQLERIHNPLICNCLLFTVSNIQLYFYN